MLAVDLKKAGRSIVNVFSLLSFILNIKIGLRLQKTTGDPPEYEASLQSIFL